MLSDEETKGVLGWILNILLTIASMASLWAVKGIIERVILWNKWYLINKDLKYNEVSNKVTIIENRQLEIEKKITEGWARQKDFIELKDKSQRELMNMNYQLLAQKIDHANDSSQQVLVFLKEENEGLKEKLKRKSINNGTKNN